MKSFIRDFRKADTPQTISVYQEAFAREPWFETWPAEEVQKDIDYCLSQRNPIFLVAEIPDGSIIGFRWAYELPPQQFPYLNVKEREAMYGDELALKKEFEGNGIATEMMKISLERAAELDYRKFWGRTKLGSRTLPIYSRLGYKNSGIEDPEMKGRFYFVKDLERTIISSAQYSGCFH